MKTDRNIFLIAAGVHSVNWICFLLAFFWMTMYEIIPVIFLPTFIYLFVMSFVIKKHKKAEIFGSWNQQGKEEFTGWRMGLIGVAACVAALSFAIGVGITEGGNVDIVDGVFWLMQRSTFVRQITWEEYKRIALAEVRILYGILIAATAHPVAYFGEVLYRTRTGAGSANRG